MRDFALALGVAVIAMLAYGVMLEWQEWKRLRKMVAERQKMGVDHGGF